MVRHCPGRAVREGIEDEAIRTVLSTVDVEVVLQRTAELLRRHFGAARVSLHVLLEGDPPQMERLLVDDPRNPTAAPGARFPAAESCCGRAVLERRRQGFDHLDAEHPRCTEEAELARLGYGAVVSFPLVFEDRAMGTLDVAHDPPEALFGSCLAHAARLAQLLAIALHNSRMVEEVRRLNRLLGRSS